MLDIPTIWWHLSSTLKVNPILNTNRLILEPFELEDLQLFLDINTDPYVRKYLWDDEIIGEGTAQEIMNQNHRHFDEDGYGLWKIRLKDREEVLGYAGLWYFFDEPQPQLIYALLPSSAGQGFATEASKAIIEYVFTQLDFSYLIAATDEVHLVSQQVALRLGMKFVEKRIENDKPTLFYRIDNT